MRIALAALVTFQLLGLLVAGWAGWGMGLLIFVQSLPVRP